MDPFSRTAATAAIVGLAGLVAPTFAQSTIAGKSPQQILSDFIVAGCLNASGRASPGIQAGSCTRLIDSGSLVPDDLVMVYVLRGYARETMAQREDDQRESRRLIGLASGDRAPPAGADELDKASKDRSERNRELAFADYAAAIRLDPQLAWKELNRGVQGDLDPVVNGEAPFPSHLYGRGVAALRLGRVAEGKADIARATQMDPGIAENFARHGTKP